MDPSAVPLEGAQLVTAGSVPKLYCLVQTGGCQAAAIGAEGYARDQRIVSFADAQFLAAGCVPHFYRPIEVGRRQPPAVGAKRNALDRLMREACEGARLVTAPSIPQI